MGRERLLNQKETWEKTFWDTVTSAGRMEKQEFDHFMETFVAETAKKNS